MKGMMVKLGKLMSVRMLAIGLTFLQTIAITRVFGSEVFGLLSFALSISALLVLFLSAGLDQVLMRDIARIGKDIVSKSKRWRHTWNLIQRYVVPLTIFISIVGVLVCGFTLFAKEYKFTLIVAFSVLPFILLRKYIEAMCQGTKQVTRSIMGSQIFYPTLMILGALYVWYFGIEANSVNIAFTYAVAVIGSFIASFILILTTLKNLKLGDKTQIINKEQQNESLDDSPSEKKLLISGIHFSLVSLGFVLGQHIDVLLMGVLSTPENVALVRIAARVAEMAALMRAIVILQYKPLMSEAYGKGDFSLLQSHVSFMVKIFVITGIPITLGLWFFAEQAMAVFGSEFVSGAWAMRIYILGVFFLLLCGPCNAILSVTDNESKASKYIWIAIFINAVLDLILIPIFGAIGCGIANAASMVFVGVLSVRASRSLLNIDTTILSILNKKQSTGD